MTVAHHPELNLTHGFTLGLWIKPADLTVHRYLVWKWNSNTGYVLHLLRSTGAVIVQIGDGTNVLGRGTRSTVPLNEWSHVVATFDGEYLRIFLNGVVDTSMPTPGTTIGENDQPLQLGLATEQGYRGVIDEVRIYNRALSEAEVAELFANSGEH
ncbi:MAG: LamG domain-containing protein [Thermococcus sp.]|nr:LamG domain-containing protein [Thermococcus sp.]